MCYAVAVFINIFPLWSINTVIMGDISISGFNVVFGGGDLGKISDIAESFIGYSENYASIENIILFIPAIVGFILSLIMDSDKRKFYIVSLILLFIGLNFIIRISDTLSSIADTTFFGFICYIAYVVGICISIVGIITVGKKAKENKNVKVVQMETQQPKIKSAFGEDTSTKDKFSASCGIKRETEEQVNEE